MHEHINNSHARTPKKKGTRLCLVPPFLLSQTVFLSQILSSARARTYTHTHTHTHTHTVEMMAQITGA
jgi:hypothetical protein